LSTLITTHEHPLFVKSRGFVIAAAVRVGDQIETRYGHNVVVKSVQKFIVEKGVLVYNFTVDSDHTYFVTGVDGGILVHNVKCTVRKGGRYNQMQINAGEEIHHMPAKSTYMHLKQMLGISDNSGPAIRMDEADHELTASYGNSRAAQAYQARQQALIEAGNWEEAILMDIEDIQSKFGTKYDDAIMQMLDGLGPGRFGPDNWQAYRR
jgi:hypothetical protein